MTKSKGSMKRKISEDERLDKALEMIEEISVHAQTLHPKDFWKESAQAVSKIYEIIHSIRTPKCRKNHPRWCKQIDDALRGKEQP